MKRASRNTQHTASAMAANQADCSQPSRIDPRVQTLLGMMEGLCFTGSIPYRFFEEAVGLGRVQIDRLFLKDIGLTPKGYLEKKLVDQARELLQGSALSVKEITHRLGFNASSHFCAWFKRKTGSYPLLFRDRPE